MKAGRFKAIVVDKMITENSKKNPQVVIQVEVEFNSEEKVMMNYYGQLTDGAVEHTLKALVACGITANDLTAPITKGTEVSVVVDPQKDEKGEVVFKNDKPQFKISWINKPMGMGEPMDPAKAKAALSKYSGALAKLRQGMGPKNHAPQSTSNEPPWPDDDSGVPF